MNRKELKRIVENAVLEFVQKEYTGKPEDFYCEIETIEYEYFEGEDEACNVKVRYGRYVEDGKSNFDKTVTFNDIQENEGEDFIRGMITATLNAFEH